MTTTDIATAPSAVTDAKHPLSNLADLLLKAPWPCQIPSETHRRITAMAMSEVTAMLVNGVRTTFIATTSRDPTI